MKRIALTLTAILLVASPVISQIINVPADQPSIQAGIDFATDGDTVLVADSTYYENINFHGKAITVASHFLMDDDTAHISKTIIDGSQATNPDTASTVLMISGEDTTSVLMGFTITGGNGTQIFWDNENNIAGGAVIMFYSGGKICNNIIEENHTDHHGKGHMIYGGTIFATVDNNHRAIIRKNLIRNNTAIGNWYDGGCLFLNGGGIILEHNSIIANSVTGVYGFGAGVLLFNYATTEAIEEIIVRNNLISGNTGSCSGDNKCHGGGIAVGYTYENPGLEIYNNIITDNSVDGSGGGIAHYMDPVVVYNNTIYNNSAAQGGNNLIAGDGTMLLFNNILGSDSVIEGSEISFFDEKKNPLLAYNNVIKEPLYSRYMIKSVGNIVARPVFESNSYNLAPNSAGIGWGLDSVGFESNEFYAPTTDYFGMARPNPIDDRVDVGAIESPYQGSVFIPDTAFLYALIDEGVDTNEDSLISYAEAETIVDRLDVRERGISGMTGIEAFVNLDTLHCSGNALTSLDVSNNTALTTLGCWENQLTGLDVSNNASLTTLWCDDNLLISLDVSANPELAKLNCGENQLTSLDVSNNLALKQLSCGDNQLTALDISNNATLTNLGCDGNKLASLDVTNNPALTWLNCDENLLTGLDVSTNTSLGTLYCGNNQLTSLNISNNTALEGLIITEMPTLFEVCVWEMPFPPSGVEADTEGSPNVYFTTDCSTGVEEKCLSELSIYPNPTNSLLTIETEYSDHYSIEITTLNGQQILMNEMEGTSYQIDLSSFQKGAYFITIRSKDFVSTRKIIKL